MPSALVTGGAGFIGSHVAELFLARGYTVEILDNLSSGKREHVDSRARLHEMDVRSAEAARLVTQTPFDVIVHLAAQIDVRKSVADPAADASINVGGTLNLIEALRQSARGTQTRFVFSSTGGALYGDFVDPPNVENYSKDPESPYGIAKLSAEYYLAYYARVHGMDTAVVRYANVYGPRQDPHGEAGVVAIFWCTATGHRRATMCSWATSPRQPCSPARIHFRVPNVSMRAHSTSAPASRRASPSSRGS